MVDNSSQTRFFHRREVLKTAPGVVYPFPKDVVEFGRLDRQHWEVRNALGKRNFCAPLQRPKAILDVGCGTGIWCYYIALAYRQARVVGFDVHPESYEYLLTNLRSQHRRKPPNLHFLTADAQRPFDFEDNEFDFTHVRYLGTSIPGARWPHMLKEAVRITRQGGWIEITDSLFEWGQEIGPYQQQLKEVLASLFTQRDIALVGDNAAEWLARAGLTRVQSLRFYLSGEANTQNTLVGIAGLEPALLHAGLVTKPQWDKILAGFQEEIQRSPLAIPSVVSWGQKPKGHVHQNETEQ